MNARTRLRIADLTTYFAAYALFLVALTAVHGLWLNVGLVALFLVMCGTKGYVMGWARDGVDAWDRDARCSPDGAQRG